MFVRHETKGEMSAFVKFVAHSADGLGQVHDLATARIVVNRLLAERSLTPKQMLARVINAPVNLCADLFVELAAFYENPPKREKLWRKFGQAANEISVRDYMLRGMEDIALPIIRRALGLHKEGTAN